MNNHANGRSSKTVLLYEQLYGQLAVPAAVTATVTRAVRAVVRAVVRTHHCSGEQLYGRAGSTVRACNCMYGRAAGLASDRLEVEIVYSL